jgi:hypothetical protein
MRGIMRAMEEPKRPRRGRPPVAPEDRLVSHHVRLTVAQWAKVEAYGGVAWLRALIDRAKLPPRAPPKEDED